MKFDIKLRDGREGFARVLVPLLVDRAEWESIKSTARAAKMPVRDFLKSALQEGIESGHVQYAEEG